MKRGGSRKSRGIELRYTRFHDGVVSWICHEVVSMRQYEYNSEIGADSRKHKTQNTNKAGTMPGQSYWTAQGLEQKYYLDDGPSPSLAVTKLRSSCPDAALAKLSLADEDGGTSVRA